MKNPIPWACVTGGARRIGRHLCEALHNAGYNVFIHYYQSEKDAKRLANRLNAEREDSAIALKANLTQVGEINTLAKTIVDTSSYLNCLVNNASSFYPTAWGDITEEHFSDLIGTNLKAPLFLTQALSAVLQKAEGNVINIIDAKAHQAQPDYMMYNIAKAGLIRLTQCQALAMAPGVRVNAIAPGSILWPEGQAALDDAAKQQRLQAIPLQQQGDVNAISDALLNLLQQSYITGQVINIDGGSSLM